MVVKDVLHRLGLHYTQVELGEAEIAETISPGQYDQVRLALQKYGLELMDDKKSVLIQQIKNVIIEWVHFSGESLEAGLPGYLGQKLKYNYAYLAHLFSEVQGMTLENFFIAHKIERVKELLVYNELTLTEIAYKMSYSSVAHLSSQFKKMTGFTTSHFKRLADKRRFIPDDE